MLCELVSCWRTWRFADFKASPWAFKVYTRNETHEQYDSSNATFNDIFVFDLQYNIANQVKHMHYMSAGFAGQHLMFFFQT
jgi:hypothetical protein